RRGAGAARPLRRLAQHRRGRGSRRGARARARAGARAMTGRARIDVHHHILPPHYTSWVRAHGIEAAGGRALPEWSAESTLRTMEENGIAKAIVSVSAPGVQLDAKKCDDATARAMAREVNEFSGRVAADHPGRFGFFATLTLPDIDGSLA